MNEYKSKSSASRALQKSRNEIRGKMCPVFKTKCWVQDCQSYSPGKCWETKRYEKTSVWNMWQATCDSPLITGVIEVNSNF